jgi:glutamate-1-semialdehyde 2,1-aminomutase
MTAGQRASVLEDVVVATWNSVGSVETVLRQHGAGIAAIIMEPYPTNNGCMEAVPGFLQAVKDLAKNYGILLIFDEIVSGFRLAPGGAQEWYGIVPDLCTFGKAFAGGLPIAGYGGRGDIMALLDGNAVAHLGTYNSGALCAAGALAVVRKLRNNGGEALQRIGELGRRLRDGLNQLFLDLDVPMSAAGPGAVVSIFASPTPPTTYRDTLTHDAALLPAIHGALLRWGIWTLSRGNFMLSAAHVQEDIDRTIDVMRHVLTRDLPNCWKARSA